MKNLIKTALLLIIYFALMFAPMFVGFLSATAWFYYPVISALIAATPFMWGAKEHVSIGGVAMFPLFWYVVMLVMGELGFPERIIAPIVVIIACEIVRKFAGKQSQMGLRLSYATASLVTCMQHLIILTRTDFYYEGAIEEMGSVEYAEAIIAFAKPGYFILLFVLTFIAGYLGTLIAEKLFGYNVEM